MRRRHGASELPPKQDPKVVPGRRPHCEVSPGSASLIRSLLASSGGCPKVLPPASRPHTSTRMPRYPLLLVFRHPATRKPLCAVGPPKRDARSSHPRGMTTDDARTARVSARRNPRAHRRRADGLLRCFHLRHPSGQLQATFRIARPGACALELRGGRTWEWSLSQRLEPFSVRWPVTYMRS